MKVNHFLLHVALLAVLSSNAKSAETTEQHGFRLWTDATGRTAEAMFVKKEDTQRVVLANREGRQFLIPISQLSQKDRMLISTMRADLPKSRSRQVAMYQPLADDAGKVAAGRHRSDLVNDPDVIKAIELLKERNSVEKTELVTERQTIMEKRYYRWGPLGRRFCVVYVPRTISVQREVKSVESNLQNGIGWDDQDDPRLGISDLAFTIPQLPAGAGGRARNIADIASTLLPSSISTVVTDEDRSLALNSVGATFSSENSKSGRPRAYRIIAKVSGLKSETIELTVMLQELDNNGDLLNDKGILNGYAEALRQSIAIEANK